MLPRCRKASERSPALPPGELISPVQACSIRSIDLGSSLISATGIMHSPAATGRPKAARICAAFFGVPIFLSASSAGGKLGTSFRATLTAANAPALSPSACMTWPRSTYASGLLGSSAMTLSKLRDDLVEVLQRAEIVSKQRQGSATIDVTVDVVRVEPDGGIEVG